MNALRRIHECLRPDGVLLDVHPQPENSQIEIWQGGRIHRLGEVDQREDHVEIEASRLHLKSFERRGLFAKKRRGVFDLLEHHPSVQSWQDRWAEEGYRLNPGPGMFDRAADLLRSEGELVIREPVRATSLRRLNADDAPAILT